MMIQEDALIKGAGHSNISFLFIRSSISLELGLLLGREV
jgi:hypothetical protein